MNMKKRTETELEIIYATWSALVEPGDNLAGILVGQSDAATALDLLRHCAQCQDITPLVQCLGPEASDEVIKNHIAGWMLRLEQVNVEACLDILDRCGGKLLTPNQPQWPTALDDLGPSAPFALWIRGRTEVLAGLSTAQKLTLVGARCATRYGEQVAADLAYDLSQGGSWVLSGGAFGIDAAAHRGALAGGGMTVAAMAGGVDAPYPRSHWDMFHSIMQNGALIAEVPCGTRPAKHRFLARNRLLAALGDMTVVVEAAARSGALSTARHALSLGRPLGAVPGQITSEMSRGTNQLLREEALCITSSGDIREILAPIGTDLGQDEYETALLANPGFFDGLSNLAARVFDAVPHRHFAPLAVIAREAGLGAEQVATQLGTLELLGKVDRQGGGYRVRAS